MIKTIKFLLTLQISVLILLIKNIKTRVITIFPPYRNSSSNLEERKLQELQRKKIGIFRSYFGFWSPQMLFNIIISP